MRVTHGASGAGPSTAVTIGNFDGVHYGHQAMVARVVEEARRRGLQSCLLTFEPHPREFFERARSDASIKGPAPTRLTSLREKLEILRGLGLERVHIERFSQTFATLRPEDFVTRVLRQNLAARWVLVGEDFCFGERRSGNVAQLASLGAAAGYELQVMKPVIHHGVRVSSGEVRDSLLAGKLERAAALLGRPYSISGRVVHGDKVGRTLGFATANIHMKHNRPSLSGIFAVRVHGCGGPPRAAVASLGVRPTVKADGAATLEVHVFDFAGDLYGRHLRVEFLHKIRDEEKYPDLETLRAQIARDCEAARSLLMEHGNA